MTRHHEPVGERGADRDRSGRRRRAELRDDVREVTHLYVPPGLEMAWRARMGRRNNYYSNHRMSRRPRGRRYVARDERAHRGRAVERVDLWIDVYIIFRGTKDGGADDDGSQWRVRIAFGIARVSTRPLPPVEGERTAAHTLLRGRAASACVCANATPRTTFWGIRTEPTTRRRGRR